MNINQFDRMDASFDRFTPLPFVSTVTGAGRALYGLSELVYGLTSSIIFGVGLLLSDQNKDDFNQSILHIFFGASNVTKGVVEAIPIVNLLVFAWNQNGMQLERKSWTEFQIAKPI